MNNPANSPGEFSLARPYGLYWRSHTLFIISTVIIGLFSETCLYGIVVPVLPFILQDRIGVPQESRQGYSSALLAANTGCSVIFSPIAGAIADRSRARRVPFIIGLLILIAVRFNILPPRAGLVLTNVEHNNVLCRPIRPSACNSEMCAGGKCRVHMDRGICPVL